MSVIKVATVHGYTLQREWPLLISQSLRTGYSQEATYSSQQTKRDKQFEKHQQKEEASWSNGRFRRRDSCGHQTIVLLS